MWFETILASMIFFLIMFYDNWFYKDKEFPAHKSVKLDHVAS